jgi:hypothetical protein
LFEFKITIHRYAPPSAKGGRFGDLEHIARCAKLSTTLVAP